MLTPLRVLMVEDSENDANLILLQMRRAGFAVEFQRVENAEQMQAALDEQSWEIVTADYSLPQFDAPAALALLQKSGLDIPFIVISGGITEEIAVALMKAGAQDYLKKDKLARLTPVLERELVQARKRREHRAAEEALGASEAQLALVFNSSADAQVLSRVEPGERFVIQAVNLAFQELVNILGPGGLPPAPGMERKEYLSSSLGMEPEVIELELAQYRLVLAERRPVHFEVESSAKGEKVALEISISPVLDQAGRCSYILWTARDVTERKRIQDELRESTERFSNAFKFAPNGMALVSLDDRYLKVNQALCEMFGYTEQELLSKKYQEITHPDDLEIGRVLTQQLLAGEIDSCQLQKRYLHKTGRVVWVLLNISLVCDDLGNPLYSISQVNDITERKQTDEALRRSEESLRAILQTAMDGFFVADMQGRLVEVNEAFCRMSGYDKLELLNMRIPDLEVVESFEDTSAHIQKVLALGGDRFESRHRRKDGSIIDVEISVQFQPLDGGRMVVFLEDISERRRAEKLAAQQSEQLRILYEASQRLNSTLDLDEIYQVICDSMASIAPYDCFFISDFDPETQLITCRAYRIDNTWLDVSSFPSIPLEEEGQGTQSLVIRTGQSMLIHDYQERRETAQNAYYVHDENNEVNQEIPPDDEITHSALIVPLKTGGALTGVIQVMSTRRIAYTENQLKMLEALALHIASAEQNALLFAQVQAELKERKQAEAELLQAHVKLEQRVIDRTQELNAANQALEKAARLKDEFLASMSHELRTPLTGILGLSEALQMVTYGELNEKQRNALKNIEVSGRHLLVLINDILDLSKIEAGRFDLQIESCSLGEICQASLQLTKGLANQKRQKVSFSMEPASIVMMADARRVKQMLVNLLGNAIKFTPYDGCLGIQVKGDLNSHEVRIAIWDEGIGIRAEDLPRLFQPFVQLDNSLSRQYAGTGLGLSLVESLAELHRGRVEVESAFGQGSRFTIVLPWLEIASHPERRTARGISSLDLKVESSQTAPLVLMADDNEMVLELVSDFLASRNYRVSTSHGGVEFLERLEQVQADIILMDIQMPGMDGIEVIRRIRAHPSVRTAALPVIAVTALAMAGDRERCLEAGANAYLSKPVQLKELAEIIETLCPR